jgi:hypothetical protein
MELSLTGIKIFIDLERAVSIVADGIFSTATIPFWRPSSPRFA